MRLVDEDDDDDGRPGLPLERQQPDRAQELNKHMLAWAFFLACLAALLVALFVASLHRRDQRKDREETFRQCMKQRPVAECSVLLPD